MFHYAMQSGLVLAQDAESADGGSLLGLLAPLIIIGGLFYFILIRPQRKRMRQLEDIRKAIDVGDDLLVVVGHVGAPVGVGHVAPREAEEGQGRQCEDGVAQPHGELDDDHPGAKHRRAIMLGDAAARAAPR